jgi:hypothetical protein
MHSSYTCNMYMSDLSSLKMEGIYCFIFVEIVLCNIFRPTWQSSGKRTIYEMRGNKLLVQSIINEMRSHFLHKIVLHCNKKWQQIL